MVAILDAMRVRLACERRIELRESAEIAAPATVGWRRPVILLPPQWREWSEGERHVVLAHEVAHVRRGDFAGWLSAQLSVVLHFYNPLVHWLARRLRIEQELAADAWGATAAGGSGPYLTTLASMALHKTIEWPIGRRGHSCPPAELFSGESKCFAKGNYLRHFRFHGRNRSLCGRCWRHSGCSLLGCAAQAAQACQPPMRRRLRKFSRRPAAAAAQPIDLAYVPSDSALVIAGRPADILKSDAGKLLVKAANSEPMNLQQTLGLPISEIEYVKFTMNDVRSGAPSRIIVRAAKPHDWTKFAATVVHDPVEVESPLAAGGWEEILQAGQGSSAFVLCQHTVVLFPGG